MSYIYINLELATNLSSVNIEDIAQLVPKISFIHFINYS